MSEEEQAKIEIWNYIFGFIDPLVVKCAIELGIADTIRATGRPMKLDEPSAAIGCAPAPLYRIMRFLVHRRVFGETRAGGEGGSASYTLTPISHLLVRDGQQSMAALVLLMCSPTMLGTWHALSAFVRGGAPPAFLASHGNDVWGYAAGNPAHSKLINDAMACNASMVVPAIVDGCTGVFEGLATVVDVGGGNGTTLQTLVKAIPWINGINFDLPHVIDAAPKHDGVEHVGGDMFLSIPKADAVFMKWVLHDWGDEDCIRILRNCKEAIPEDKGKVLIVEAVIVEEDRSRGLSDVRLMVDMVMMAHTNNGKERTEAEWKSLLSAAGFSRYKIKPIPSVQSVIEAYP
ncbi:hypothetical protein AAC387_Pa07g1054 [Persea americana]